MKGLFDHNQAHMCNLQDCFEFPIKIHTGTWFFISSMLSWTHWATMKSEQFRKLTRNCMKISCKFMYLDELGRLQ
jgi:hypothetical protein